MDGKMMRTGGVLAVVLGLVLAGCGGGGSDSSDTQEIRQMLISYYEHPAPEQCETLTTGSFRGAVYGGNGSGAMNACREHQRDRRAEQSFNRTVFVNHVRIHGERAVAEASAGGIVLTEGLIKSHGDWRLDDEVSPFHDSAAYKNADKGEEPEPDAPLQFGAPARFTNIPGVPPSTAITLVARPPIDPGTDRTGAAHATARIGNDFGRPGPVQQLRFVNLPITLINTGSRPFRGDVGAFATDEHGKEFTPLDRRELTQHVNIFGRLPDWTTGVEKGVLEGTSLTRYLTFAIPEGDRIVKWRLQPEVLSGPSSVTALEPMEGITYGAPSAK